MTTQAPPQPPQLAPPPPPAPVAVTAISRGGMTRAQLLQLVSWGGIVVSFLTLGITLPTLLSVGGSGPFFANVLGDIWIVALIAVACAFSRTMPWRALIGLFFTGFFGITALATLVGRPFVTALGSANPLASAVWVPLTEELLKALPIFALLLLARRHRDVRPSMGDAALLGALVGAGFELYEDALFGRTSALQWGAAPPFSWLIPSVGSTSGGGMTVTVGGHLVWTSLVAMSLAAWLLYGKRYRLAWIGVPIALAAAVFGHMAGNGVAGLDATAAVPVWIQLLAVVTLDGYLAPILFVAALAGAVFIETRRVRRSAPNGGMLRPWYAWILLPSAETARRSRVLAAMQEGGR